MGREIEARRKKASALPLENPKRMMKGKVGCTGCWVPLLRAGFRYIPVIPFSLYGQEGRDALQSADLCLMPWFKSFPQLWAAHFDYIQ